MDTILSMKGIRKEYPGVLALDSIDFDLKRGEVHCLVGENGAGKSTLVKILSGAISANSGTILINGNPASIHNPLDAQKAGIGIIYQDFKLVPELSAAENIMLGNEPLMKRLPFVDVQSRDWHASQALGELGEKVDLGIPVKHLSIAHQQLVEIAKAISKQVRILALDEPSAPLTDTELAHLFMVIRKLKEDGVGIIYISHRLEEVFAIGDRVSILRDGKMILTTGISGIDRRGLVRAMVGREIEDEFPKSEHTRGKEILRIENLSTAKVHDISLTLNEGEILGLAGLVGAGRSEIARALFGADPVLGGKIFLQGAEINPISPKEAIALGIGLLTEDRNQYGLLMEMNVKENMTLSNLDQFRYGPFIAAKKESFLAQKYTNELRIKTPGLEQPVEYLSGGNRQKVIVARWLLSQSKLLIFDEPTLGIDVGVKYEIYMLMHRLIDQGIGIIVISSDLPELLGIADRIAVLCEGRLAGVLSRKDATQERIMTLATETTVVP